MQDENPQESTTLEQDVESALLRIRELPDIERFRCYEFSRKLREELTPLGHDVVVKDGFVLYAADFFTERVKERSTGQQEEYEKFVQGVGKDYGSHLSLSNKMKMIIFHSWLEVGDSVVDYHTIDESPLDMLIVERKNELGKNAVYVPIGGEVNIFGRTYIYNSPFITRLRT